MSRGRRATECHPWISITSAVGAAAVPRLSPDAERLRLFGEELDGVKRRAMARVGDEDLRRVRRLDFFSCC